MKVSNLPFMSISGIIFSIRILLPRPLNGKVWTLLDEYYK